MDDEKNKKIKLKCIYYADYGGNPEEECDYIIEYYQVRGFDLDILNLIAGRRLQHWQDKYFDIMFFDYGGLLPGCSSLIEHECDNVIRYAEENPSKLIVITSLFTSNMLNDRIMHGEIGLLDGKPANILMKMEELIDYL